MATVKEIAEKSGVSIGTVDRVLHNRGRVSAETRQRVLSVAEALQYVPNRAAQSLVIRKKKLHLGFLTLTSEDHPFFQDINEAAYRQAVKLEEFGVRVSFIYNVLPRSNDVKSSELIMPEGVTPEMLDGLALAGGIPDVFLPQNLGKTIPMTFYNLLEAEDPGLLYVGCDYRKSGTIAAGLCALTGGENAKIAIVSEGYSVHQMSNFSLRVDGFSQRLRDAYPQCSIVGHLFFTADHAENTQLVRDFLAKNQDITSVYVVNPADYDICRIIRSFDPERQISIITNDLVPVQKKMLREGIISATITQEPETQGALPLETLFRFLAFGERPANPYHYTKLEIVIANNMR